MNIPDFQLTRLDTEVKRLLKGVGRLAAHHALALFPTGGTLIGPVRWGHVIGQLPTRTNVTDLDLDMIMLVLKTSGVFSRRIPFFATGHRTERFVGSLPSAEGTRADKCVFAGMSLVAHA